MQKFTVTLDAGAKTERRVQMTLAEFKAWNEQRKAEAMQIFRDNVAAAGLLSPL